MSFSLYASTGSTTTQLNDGSPFWLERAEGMSGAPVNRHAQRGPAQDGVTDLGYRLRPREVTLYLLFYAATDTLLDTYRQTLTDVFNPLPSISTFLTVERDDGELRKLICHVVGEIEISLVPEERAAHLHRAVVKLRAADPLYYANSTTSVTFDYGTADQWWLAGGTIAASQILSVAEYPAVSDPIVPFGTVTSLAVAGGAGSPWAVAILTEKHEGGGGANQYAWSDFGSAGFYYGTATSNYRFNQYTTGKAWPGSTTLNFHVVGNSGNDFWYFGSASTLDTYVVYGVPGSFANGGRWRHRISYGLWLPELPRAVLLKDFTFNQLVALRHHMLANTIGNTNSLGSVNIVNDGDVPAYPTFTITGPMSDLVITNQTTGDTIDLTGLDLSGTATYILDLSGGNKTLVDATSGSTALGSVTTSPAGMADFYIAPAPIASGGTNAITFTVGSASTNASFSVEFTNRYLGF